MSTKIKFCGLRRDKDLEYVAKLGADFAGFILSPGFKRTVSEELPLKAREILPEGTQIVGVFVDEDLSRVEDLLGRGIIDIAQLHGNEDEAYIRALREASGKPVIKMIRVTGEGDILRAQNSSADYVLLDSGAGGTGKLIDWSLAGTLQRPYFLAGGLTADNVYEAVTKLNPYAVDVSSGIETDGVKDFDKMNRFAGEVRKHE